MFDFQEKGRANEERKQEDIRCAIMLQVTHFQRKAACYKSNCVIVRPIPRASFLSQNHQWFEQRPLIFQVLSEHSCRLARQSVIIHKTKFSCSLGSRERQLPMNTEQKGTKSAQLHRLNLLLEFASSNFPLKLLSLDSKIPKHLYQGWPEIFVWWDPHFTWYLAATLPKFFLAKPFMSLLLDLQPSLYIWEIFVGHP